MKFEHLRHGTRYSIEVEPAHRDEFDAKVTAGCPVVITRSESRHGIYARFGNAAPMVIRGVRSTDETHLEHVLQTMHHPLMAVLPTTRTTDKPETVVIQVHEFKSLEAVEAMDFGIDELFLQDAGPRVPELRETASAIEWLTEQFTLEHGDEATRIMMIQASAKDDLQGSYRIISAKWGLDVSPNEDGQLLARRLVALRETQTLKRKRPPLLLMGRLEFKDARFATRFAGKANQLDEIVRSAGSYLGIWESYQKLEADLILKRFQMVGSIPYDACDMLDNGDWTFQISDRFFSSGGTLDRLNQDHQNSGLECVTKIPAWFDQDKGGEGLLKELDNPEREEKKPYGSDLRSIGAREVVLRAADLDTKMESRPPEKGLLVPSLRGDLVRLKRQREAWERITGQESPMPHLGLLIEERPTGAPKTKRVVSQSAKAKEKFGGEPNQKQADALDIALNTPDIAVIQGPPGTGKTRVLAAVQARLSELQEGHISGNVLLTGYQHVAVENAAASAKTLGLPPIKIGRKRGTERSFDPVEEWTNERIDTVRARLDTMNDPPINRDLRQIRQMIITYQLPLNSEETDATTLERLKNLAGAHVTDQTMDRINEFTLKQSTQNRGEKDSLDEAVLAKLLKMVEALKTEPTGYLDSTGGRAAMRVLDAAQLKERLTEANRNTLEAAIDWQADPEGQDVEPAFLDELAGLKRDLLQHLDPHERPPAPADPDPRMLDLIQHVESELSIKVEQSPAGKSDVLWNYLDTLENDHDEVRNAIERYTMVLAATCQQALHQRTRKIKGATEDDTPTFETVIVDEAARATPLDLLIPMSLASRRIVLVGDHRQLPHMLEKDVESQLEGSNDEKTSEALKQSMFERLFLHLKRLEREDGKPRTITLDKQYRMHPTLGEFVSKTFYEEDEQFESPRPATDFLMGLETIPESPAIWIDVPASMGHERRGQSKSRPCEAGEIAKKVKAIGAETVKLSIGVIAPYGAQVRELERAFAKVGVGEIGPSGEFKPVPEWRHLKSEDGALEERLRIGTVDAFQGMEFDIVFLSLTRSNDLPDETEQQRRSKYGFLMLPNRLCVAMSRQKRSLVVVGDYGMTRSTRAAEVIPGVVEYANLCRNHGKVIDHG